MHLPIRVCLSDILRVPKLSFVSRLSIAATNRNPHELLAISSSQQNHTPTYQSASQQNCEFFSIILYSDGVELLFTGSDILSFWIPGPSLSFCKCEYYPALWISRSKEVKAGSQPHRLPSLTRRWLIQGVWFIDPTKSPSFLRHLQQSKPSAHTPAPTSPSPVIIIGNFAFFSEAPPIQALKRHPQYARTFIR